MGGVSSKTRDNHHSLPAHWLSRTPHSFNLETQLRYWHIEVFYTHNFLLTFYACKTFGFFTVWDCRLKDANLKQARRGHALAYTNAVTWRKRAFDKHAPVLATILAYLHLLTWRKILPPFTRQPPPLQGSRGLRNLQGAVSSLCEAWCGNRLYMHVRYCSGASITAPVVVNRPMGAEFRYNIHVQISGASLTHENDIKIKISSHTINVFNCALYIIGLDYVYFLWKIKGVLWLSWSAG